MPHARASHNRLQQARQKRQRPAKRRRLEHAREHRQREQARAQRHLRALEQALVDLGRPATLAAELEWRLKPMGKLLGNSFGLMCPTLLGCPTTAALTRVRLWDQHLPGKLLGAWPKRKWGRRWQRMGQELLVRLGRQVADQRPATRSRWPWTWAADDRVFKTSGPQLSVVGRWWSAQEHRVRLGIDGLLLVVVIGDGKLVVPVDFEVRRPAPVGPGGPCRDQRTWLQVMLDRTWAALRRRCRRLPPPLVVADSWCGDSKGIGHVATHRQGTWLVEGKRTYAFQRPDGRRVQGHDFRTRDDGPGHDSAQRPGVRYARLTASSPTDGMVTVVIMDAPGEERFSLRCRQ